MRITVEAVTELWFDDGLPVRAASAIAPHLDGHLIAQDDATSGALVRGDRVERIRLLPPVEEYDVFASADGTKHLKPDLEAACAIGGGRILLLGSGSTPARMRGIVLAPTGDPIVLDLTQLCGRVASVLGIEPAYLNLEGSCLVGDRLRWFNRGLPAAGLTSASVDVPLADLLTGTAVPENPMTWDLGIAGGVGLAITDAATLADGRILVSAAAEDSPTTYDDGPVVGAALVVLHGAAIAGNYPLPLINGAVAKLEGVTVVAESSGGATILGVVDADDPLAPSLLLNLTLGR